MDRLEVAIALIQEAKEEKKRLEAMEKEVDKIPLDSSYWSRVYEIREKYNPVPCKAVINDNLKIARRLLARAYM